MYLTHHVRPFRSFMFQKYRERKSLYSSGPTTIIYFSPLFILRLSSKPEGSESTFYKNEIKRKKVKSGQEVWDKKQKLNLLVVCASRMQYARV